MALDNENQPYRGQLQRPARKLYQGVVLYDKLNDEIEEIAKMDVREDDIWICSFPRSGTTLTQELVYLIQTLDFDTAQTVQLEERVPFLDWKMDAHPYCKGLKYVEQLKSPRMIKSHLHHFLLPEALQQGRGRIIYICRNPKDVAVSYFRYLSWTEMIHDEYNTMDLFVDKFKDGLLFACPWPRHILGYWERRHDPKVLFLEFEDVVKISHVGNFEGYRIAIESIPGTNQYKTLRFVCSKKQRMATDLDLPAAILRIADFLKRSLSPEDVTKIAEHCSVENMKKNDMVNLKYMSDLKPMNTDVGGAFINKGLPGGWHGVLTSEQSAKIDEMTKELEGTGLNFLRC